MLRVRVSITLIMALVLCCVPQIASSVTCRFEQIAASASDSQIPYLVIPHIQKAPKIDGVLGPDEWKGAEDNIPFVIVGTKQPSDPPTKAWLAIDDKNIYAAFRCTLAPGFEPKAAAKTHDGLVWQDDAVEFFIWPDTSKNVYYQFLSNPGGCQSDVEFTAQAPLIVNANNAWNPKWTAKAGRERDAWTLEMAIPLSSVGLRPQGSHCVRLNICRDIRLDDRRIVSWSHLSTTHGDIHNRSHEFGAAICAFETKRGERINSSKVTGVSGLSSMTADYPDQITLLPNGYSLTVTPTPALPSEMVNLAGCLLQASIRPVGLDGKEGKAVQVGKLRLKTSDPVKTTITGLQPGDYKLKLTLSSQGKSSSAERLIQVRKPNEEPKIEGTIVSDERDWKASDSVANAAGIDHTLTSGLQLQTQLVSPVLAFDPTDDETITCMTEFQDKLYVGSCTEPAVTDTGSVYTYDPDLDAWNKAFQVNEQGLVTMGVFGDKLYIPGYDANDGDWDLGNIYIHDGKSWIEKRTVPRAIHIYGLVVYHGRIYVSADILDPAPEGVPFQQAADQGLMNVYGRVVSSGDGGQTWREEYRGKMPGQDIGYMTVFQDKIILNASNDLIVFDGKNWTPMNLNPDVMFIYDFVQNGDTLLLATQNGLFFYNGKQLWRSTRTWSQCLRGITRFGDNWVLTSYLFPGTAAGHGPGGVRCPVAPGKKDYGATIPSISVLPNELLMETPDHARVQSDDLWNQYRWIGSQETPAACRTFHGRVYIGTHPNGRVMVLPVCSEGALVSSPKKLDGSNAYRLWWNAATPPGTSINFQIRTAPSAKELEKKLFVGPDGTTKSRFESQGMAFSADGAEFVQYRLILKTANTAKTPYVKRVVVTSSKP